MIWYTVQVSFVRYLNPTRFGQRMQGSKAQSAARSRGWLSLAHTSCLLPCSLGPCDAATRFAVALASWRYSLCTYCTRISWQTCALSIISLQRITWHITTNLAMIKNGLRNPNAVYHAARKLKADSAGWMSWPQWLPTQLEVGTCWSCYWSCFLSSYQIAR